jgi:Glycine rich protein
MGDAKRTGSDHGGERRLRFSAVTTGRAAPVALCLLGGALILPAAALGARTQTYTYTGGERIFVVPAGVSRLDVFAIGGSGGESVQGRGGAPAAVEGTIRVHPGQTLYMEVGGKGQKEGQGGAGGFNGGGSGHAPFFGSGGGGGASDVRAISLAAGDPETLESRLIVAAGGGGAGGPGDIEGERGAGEPACHGGAGGAAGEAGEVGGCPSNPINAGQAGVQTEGGAAGTTEAGPTGLLGCGPGEAGALGSGGAGGGYWLHGETQCDGGSGGGGGGGLYGGGGAAGSEGEAGGGGGGGSSLVPPHGTVALAPLDAEPMVQISWVRRGARSPERASPEPVPQPPVAPTPAPIRPLVVGPPLAPTASATQAAEEIWAEPAGHHKRCKHRGKHRCAKQSKRHNR